MLVFVFIHIVEHLHEILAVPEQLIQPPAAALEDLTAAPVKLRLSHDLRQLFDRAQSGQVVDATERIGSVELDVIGVVLPTVRYAVSIRVPVSTGIVDRALDAGPDLREPLPVGAQLPLPQYAQDAAHLPVEGGLRLLIAPRPDELLAEGFEAAEGHPAVGLGLDGELDAAHLPLQAREEEGHCLGIAPHVRTASLAAAGVVKTAFPAQEAPIFEPEAGRAAQRHNVG